MAGTLLGQCHIVGWLGVIGAVVTGTQGEPVASGVCLLAAAVAFGMAANAALRQ